EMIASFNIDNVHLGGPVFDREKLDWLNGRWIRENLDDSQFADRVSEWALNRDNLMRVIPLIRGRVEKFTDIAPLTAFLFSGFPSLTAESFAHNRLEPETVQRILQFSSWR